MAYNSRYTLNDIFANPRLVGILPQFGKPTLQSGSDAVVEKWILEYLASVLNGQITGDNELVVNGKHKSVLRRVNAIKSVLEDFIKNMPAIAKNLKRNTKLYMPFVTSKELEGTSGTDIRAKILKIVLENITYNPDIDETNNKMQSQDFVSRQNAWMKKVGYKEKKL